MLSTWQLPKTATFGHTTYRLHTDFRDILEIFSYFDREELPAFMRWQIALGLFYDPQVAPEHTQQAMDFLAEFINGGSAPKSAGPKLLDWQLDADLIIADVNRVAGTELRAQPYVHWWTFLAWFHAIGQGQLSTVVSIRDALHRGQKLEGWQKTYLQENRSRVLLQKPLTESEKAHKAALEKMLTK